MSIEIPVKRHIGEQLWTQWLKKVPDHPSIMKGASPIAELSALTANGDGALAERQDSDFILKIARPRLSNPPTPPALIEPWLEPGWEDPSKEVSPRRNEPSAGGAARVRFESDPQTSWRHSSSGRCNETSGRILSSRLGLR